MKDQVALIFLHGVMANSQIWMPQVEHFKDNSRVIVLDLRGHGRSDKPREKYSIKRFSCDLFSFMKSLKIEKAVIADHSMGGMIAMRFTLDHEKMVENLVLIDTSPRSSYSFGRRLVFLGSQLAMSVAYKSFMRYYLSRVFRRDYPRAEIEKAVEKVLVNPRYVVKSCFSAIQGFDVLSELDNIGVPTLIIHGSQSINPLEQALDLKERTPSAELVIIEGGGHSITSETPEEICLAIEKFI
jgi:pimeloyl-ACP methyl ester carboxylesterase